MNKITLHPDHFSSQAQVFDELEMNGMFIKELDVDGESKGPHWQAVTSWLYVLEGELTVTDIAQDKTLKATPGSRLDIPERVLHEEETPGYRAIAGYSDKPESPESLELSPENLEDNGSGD